MQNAQGFEFKREHLAAAAGWILTALAVYVVYLMSVFGSLLGVIAMAVLNGIGVYSLSEVIFRDKDKVRMLNQVVSNLERLGKHRYASKVRNQGHL